MHTFRKTNPRRRDTYFEWQRIGHADKRKDIAQYANFIHLYRQAYKRALVISSLLPLFSQFTNALPPLRSPDSR